ncbi:hypothetical protein KCU57_12460 [Xanthomonas translucens]|uniref:hypothetical protein n=1 Tax=Xanthomonas campestris pv. translucens TaxID=343 RepID=UPI001F3F2541|nr:hypothetical protein [Xanthomonas translucens]UKE49583.1 hypothetical protein KCU57_12460 [Xanthomonas translucens]
MLLQLVAQARKRASSTSAARRCCMPSRWISRTASAVALNGSCTWRSMSMSITARWLARAVFSRL